MRVIATPTAIVRTTANELCIPNELMPPCAPSDHGQSTPTRHQPSSVGDESVALAAHGLDAHRPVDAPLDLPAELRDVHLARAAVADVRAVPQRFHDRRTAHRAAGLVGEQHEQPKLRRSEVHLAAADHCARAIEIQAYVADD